MLRNILTVLLSLTAVPIVAQNEQEVACGHQADIVQAIAQARLDRVREGKLPEVLAENATWPENYNRMIPVLAPHMYGLKRRDIRGIDWRSNTFEQCMNVDPSTLQGG